MKIPQEIGIAGKKSPTGIRNPSGANARKQFQGGFLKKFKILIVHSLYLFLK